MPEEKSMVEYFKEYQKQMNSFSKNVSFNQSQTPSIPVNDNMSDPLENYSGFTIGQGFDNQGKGLSNDVLESKQNIPNTTLKPPLTTPNTAPNAPNVCPECGTIHPPLKPGQKCPIVQNQQALKKANISEDKISQFVQNLKNIIIANLSKMNVESSEKVLQEITIEVTKFLENYSTK